MAAAATEPAPTTQVASATLSPKVASPTQLDPVGTSDASTPNTPTEARSQADARSKTITVADGVDTQGLVNRHPAPEHVGGVRVGVSEDRNRKCRRTMEDSHAFIYDYGGVRGQGFFAVFDGHAGKHAAEWCGQNFHEYLLAELRAKPDEAVPDLLNNTFHEVDSKLSQLAADEGTHSGCTAVTAFLRLETADGKPIGSHGGAGPPTGREGEMTSESPSSSEKKSSGQKIRDLFKRHSSTAASESSSKPTPAADGNAQPAPLTTPPSGQNVRRALYTANVGDARAVLSRGGKAVRLTYDHKGSDPQEVKRITDAGGFVLNQRVNGVLAVTRALGDASVKQFVSGSPYTTETTLGDEDTQLIIACDGLWDVCSDQQAVDLIKDVADPQEASRKLLEHALGAFSTDNLSVLVVALGPSSG